MSTSEPNEGQVVKQISWEWYSEGDSCLIWPAARGWDLHIITHLSVSGWLPQNVDLKSNIRAEFWSWHIQNLQELVLIIKTHFQTFIRLTRWINWQIKWYLDEPNQITKSAMNLVPLLKMICTLFMWKQKFSFKKWKIRKILKTSNNWLGSCLRGDQISYSVWSPSTSCWVWKASWKKEKKNNANLIRKCMKYQWWI